ncbi:MAG: antibiotic biosynthesis monooxygenase [Chloroflexi bacterium]|nr:antibiotic biosynthesis monooxygenase [Chloroflexota bacterium]|tara:strand:- start:7879 stop:8169 length:291 start_codon:yes stop_codon:yes gene_type:complete
MNHITIVSNITAKDSYIEEMKRELTKLVEPSQFDEGCKRYELYQNSDNPSHFKIIETWINIESWEEHMSHNHITDFLISTSGMFEKFHTNQLNLIA